jgi:hypothetical protein
VLDSATCTLAENVATILRALQSGRIDP